MRTEAERRREADPYYQWQMGRLALGRDDVETGITSLRRAAHSVPGFIEPCKSLIALASASVSPGDRADLLRTSLEAVAGDDHVGQAEMASLFLAENMRAEALTAIDRAIAVQSRWPYHRLRARILLASNDVAGAIEALQEAIGGARNGPFILHHPDQGQTSVWRTRLDEPPAKPGRQLGRAAMFTMLARLLVRQGRLADAEEAAMDSVDIDPGFPGNWLELASCLKLSGKDDEAQGVLTRCCDLASRLIARLKHFDYAQAQVIALIGILVEAGDLQAAEAEIAAARAAGLKSFRLEEVAAGLARKRDAPEAAADCLKRALEEAPTRIGLYTQLAAIRSQQERWEDVADVWRAATSALPHNAQAHNALSSVLDRLDDLDGAIVALRQAIHLRGDKAAWHCDLGALLARQEHWSDAASACRRAIMLAPDLTRAHRLLAACQGRG